MKKTKLCSAVIALLALGVVACNGGNKSSAPASSSSSSAAPASSSSSSAAPSSSSESSAAPSSSSSAAPAADALYSWSTADVKAGLSNGGSTEIKDETGDVQFTAYKLGTANDTATFKWTPTAEQAGSVSFVLSFTTKATNATNATFWYSSGGSSRKMSVSVDGADQAVPVDGNPNFQDLAGGADGVVESDANDGGSALANPIDYALCTFTAVAGTEHTIVVTYLGGGYSFHVCGAKIVRA